MNKDVKVGLAILLLLLVVVFVWLAIASSKSDEEELAGRNDLQKNDTDASAGTGGLADPRTDMPPAGVTSADASAVSDYHAPVDPGSDTGSDDTAALDMGGTDVAASDPAAGTPGVGETPSATQLYDDWRRMRGVASSTDTPRDTGETVSVLSTTPSSYVVKRGDTLSGISKTVYNTARLWRRIAEANHIPDPSRVRPGMVLTIPALTDAERTGLTSRTTVTLVPGSGERRHKVVTGDTFMDISKKYYGTTRYAKEIMVANRIEDDRRLRVGTLLVIPEIASATPETGSPTGATVVGRSYTVQQGDTPGSISKRFYGTTQLYTIILEANGIADERSLRAGRTIVIPERPEGARTPRPRSDEPKLEPGEQFYVVQEGDVLSEIAYDQLGSREHYVALMRRNHIVNERTIRTGQIIIIPSRSALRSLSTRSADR